jgi:polyhydroxyalkanoate synthesis regulator phasin
MEESLKKLVYAGVGFAAQASEKFEKSINDLVKKGKIEEKEGKKIVDDFFKKSEKTKDSFEAKFKSTAEEIIARFKFAPQSEVEALNKRIAKLEKMVAKPAAKKTTRKPAAKKPAAKTTATPEAAK